MNRDFLSSVTEGDRPAQLAAMRDNLALMISLAEPKEVAALNRELRAVLDDLDKVPAQKGSTVDEIAKRRADRRAAASSPKRSRSGK